MNISAVLEAILFVASAPLTIKKLAQALGVGELEVSEVIPELREKYAGQAGIYLLESGDTIQFSTNPQFAEFVDKFTKSEVSGELTKAQLETLTVVAYRGPITRPELEDIRGVNCAIILRNLLMRGLINEYETKDSLMPVYELSIEALRFLGISRVDELPDFVELSQHPHFDHKEESHEE